MKADLSRYTYLSPRQISTREKMLDQWNEITIPQGLKAAIMQSNDHVLVSQVLDFMINNLTYAQKVSLLEFMRELPDGKKEDL